jgi:rhamnulokinase
MQTYYLAIDLGASGGRHIIGSLSNGQLKLEEIYRFDNGMEKISGQLCWNTEKLFHHILEGMKRCKELGKIPISVGIDTWGVDFVLVNQSGEMLGQAVGYRDHRTERMDEVVNRIVSLPELYHRTGIPKQMYNTIYQLIAIKEAYPEQLEQAETMLMTPDYYHYLLTGERKQEFTIASTSQLVDVHTKDWDSNLIEKLGLPRRIFSQIQKPGSLVGNLKEEIMQQVGFPCQVVMPSSHDTASAVLAIPSNHTESLYISSGTWSLMGIESKDPINSMESLEAGFTNEGGYAESYRYMKNIMGLWMIQSVRKEIGNEYSFDEICELASKERITSLIDCNDASFLSPDSMVEAVKVYCKNTAQQVPETLGEIAAVIYHSLAKCYADTKRQIEELTGKHFDCIHIIGGGSQADYLNKLTAKYTGCKVLAGPTEATATGNILAQMLRNNEFSSVAEARECVATSFGIIEYE